MTTSQAEQYDVIVIGSGQAGTPLANAFQRAGQRTLLIERDYLGGCCVNVGCSPTKTLIASGRAAYVARRGPDYGIYTDEKKQAGKNELFVDMQKVRQRKRDIVSKFRSGNEQRAKDAGVDVCMGDASFVDAKTLRIVLKEGGGEKIVRGEKIFVNVGERPAAPRLDGVEKLDPGMVLDSSSILELGQVPAHLVVVGGGYVGVEFAELYARLGAKVTLVQRGKQLLPQEDDDVAAELLRILQDEGLDIHLETQTVNIEAADSENFTLNISKAGRPSMLTGTKILFATGRVPNTDTLNLRAAGIKTNAKGYIISNEYLETSVPDIYVLGDAKGPPAFKHVSDNDFRIISHNLLVHPQSTSASSSGKRLSTKERLVPYIVYTDPQLGHVGLHAKEAIALTQEQAQADSVPKRRIQIATMPMSNVARALETDEARGMIKAVVDADSGLILGFTCLGMEGGELLAVVQMAMVAGARYEVLRDAVWSHPSLAEGLNHLWDFLRDV